MRAYVVPAFGAPGAVAERPTPEAGEGEILVRVRAAGVNAMDPIIVAGYAKDYMEHRLPLVPGIEYAGMIEAIGPGVEGLAPGDEVFGAVAKPYFGGGSWAEYVTANAALARRRPEGLDAPTAATLAVAGGTALALVEAAGVKAGQTVLVVGAAGGVGSIVVQLAARAGATVIAATSAQQADEVRTLGASEVVDYAGDLLAQVKSGHPEGVDSLIDNFHDAAGLLALASAVKPGGRVASPVAQGVEQAFADQPVSASQVNAASDRAGELADLVVSGDLRVPVTTHTLADGAQALDAQATRQAPGKLVIVLD
jgi:NADPH:quinone reductase-like Zn-dependent oxidoreductase